MPDQPLDLEFSGSGGEYFSIWIVNVLLTIATFGIYAAWAKVRTKRYFYANTSLGGHAFEYLAEPKRILIGNLIVVGVYILFTISAAISPILQGIFMLLIAIAMPWIIAASVLFNARNSAWRGLRFGFVGNYGGAFFQFIVLPLLMVLSFGLLLPYVMKRQRAWLVENHRFGRSAFRFSGRSGDFYKIYLKAAAFFIGPALLMAMLLPLFSRMGGASPVLAILSPVVVFGSMLFGSAFLRASIYEYAWTNTSLDSHMFFSVMRARDLLALHVVNLLMLVVTLGLAWPWVAVRTARFQLGCLTFVPSGSLDGFVASAQPAPGALAEAAGDFLDFDIGFGV